MTFRAIDLTGFTPAVLRPQPVPVVQWVAIDDLVIDERYQRELTRAGRRHIQKMAEGFDWKAFGAICVAAAEGGKLAVVDGQHRVHAAALAGRLSVPAVIVPMTAAEQAAAFHAVNSARVRLDRSATFRAQLAAADPLALRADAAVAAAGCVLMRTIPSSSQRQLRQVFTHALILRMVAEGLGDVVTVGLRAVAESAQGREVGADLHLGLRVWDQSVLAIWLPLLATDQRFLRLPLAQIFDAVPWLEWIETARDAANRAPAGPSAKARVTGQVEGLLRQSLAERRAA